MNLTEIQNVLREKVRETARDNFGVGLDQIALEIPPKTELGDLAFPVAFELAKLIKQQTGEKQNPRAIAETFKTELEKFDFVARIEIAGPGYLNIFYQRSKFLSDNLAANTISAEPNADRSKVCVEHTSVNPNKAAHVGHLRNSVLGDTFQRILKANGKRVEVQNYIDNTGVQVADVVVGFIHLENRDLDSIKKLDAELAANGTSFDYYCWDLYTKVGQEYQKNEELKAKRAAILHELEKGGNETAELAEYVATRNVQCISDTMERFSIRYDLLPRESEILHLHFWEMAFEKMKQLGVVHFESIGKQAGCWVMPFEEHSGTDEHESDKILVRSNGTVTYTGKDIAYQMWKLGILGLDFHYRPFRTNNDGSTTWITTDDESESLNAPSFGHGEKIFNVIDSRQSYPQDIVRKGVAAIDPEKGERASVHLSYEMVTLSPAAAEELGFALSDEDGNRPFIEMSGRKGLGVKVDDLLNRLEEIAHGEVESRHPDISSNEKTRIAHQLAVGALRYFLLKFTRNTIIIFDFKEALSFEGETGCFCQYSAVRANSVFRKLEERGESADELISSISQIDTSEVFTGPDGNSIWEMLMLSERLNDVLSQAEAACEPAILAKYTFNLAKSFNLFYHNHKILPETDPHKRSVLIAVADKARSALTRALATMGIEVPEKM